MRKIVSESMPGVCCNEWMFTSQEMAGSELKKYLWNSERPLTATMKSLLPGD